MDAFFDAREFRTLASELRPGMGDCPFVIDSAAAKHVSLLHFHGGSDATYVVVLRKLDGAGSLDPLSVNISYLPFVEGTTIIYDATAETMQGKARPFVCRLQDRDRFRVYAVLPFQVEVISLRGESEQLSIGFLDARGERVVAALPFELRLIDVGGEVLSAEYLCTNRSGHFSCDAARATRAIVRSLLTGSEQSLTLDPHNARHD